MSKIYKISIACVCCKVMGRTLSWYIVPRFLEHDKTKELCFDLEYEPEDSELLFDNTVIAHKCLYSEDHETMWCPKCLMFAHGYLEDISLESLDISHSYGNPIWRSDWNIRYFCGGSSSNFTHLFDRDRLYKEVTKRDIAYLQSDLEDLGEPVRPNDIAACKETMEVIDFCKKWMDNDSVRIIKDDEI
jgi:hypothetical protein